MGFVFGELTEKNLLFFPCLGVGVLNSSRTRAAECPCMPERGDPLGLTQDVGPLSWRVHKT